jgi:hypothetical protein
MLKKSRIARRAAVAFAALALVPAAASADVELRLAGGPGVLEGTNAHALVVLDRPAAGNETVTLETRAGRAQVGTDFDAQRTINVAFAQGQQAADVFIQTVADGIAEGMEDFGLAITGARNAGNVMVREVTFELTDAVAGQAQAARTDIRETQAIAVNGARDIAQDLRRFALDRQNDLAAQLRCELDAGCRGNVVVRVTGGDLAAGLRRGVQLGRETFDVAQGAAQRVEVDTTQRIGRLLAASHDVQITTTVTTPAGTASVVSHLL